jgi:hypothetical protein
MVVTSPPFGEPGVFIESAGCGAIDCPELEPSCDRDAGGVAAICVTGVNDTACTGVELDFCGAGGAVGLGRAGGACDGDARVVGVLICGVCELAKDSVVVSAAAVTYVMETLVSAVTAIFKVPDPPPV